METDRPSMWGPAAGAQSQSTPGASASVAPHQQVVRARSARARLAKEWLGVLEATVLAAGLAGLIAGMYLFAAQPLLGVAVMLLTTTLLLGSAAKLSEAQEMRLECNTTGQRSSRRRVDSSAS